MKKFKEKGIMVSSMKNKFMKPLFVLTVLLVALLMVGCTEDEIFDAPTDFENLNMTLSFKNNRLYSGYLLETTIKDEDTEVARLTKSLSFNNDIYELYQKKEMLNHLDGDDETVIEEATEYYTLTEHYYQDNGIWVKEEGNFNVDGTFLLLVSKDMFEEDYDFKKVNNLVIFSGKLKADKVQHFIPGFELDGATNAAVEITYNNNARQLQILTLSYLNDTNKEVTITLKVSYKIHQITLPNLG